MCRLSRAKRSNKFHFHQTFASAERAKTPATQALVCYIGHVFLRFFPLLFHTPTEINYNSLAHSTESATRELRSLEESLFFRNLLASVTKPKTVAFAAINLRLWGQKHKKCAGELTNGSTWRHNRLTAVHYIVRQFAAVMIIFASQLRKREATMRSKCKQDIQKFAAVSGETLSVNKSDPNICDFSLRRRDLFARSRGEEKLCLFVNSKHSRNSFFLPKKNSNNWYNTKCLLNKLLIVTGERFFAVGDGVDGGKTVVIVIDTPKCNKIMSVTGSPTSALMWGRATAKRSTIS